MPRFRGIFVTGIDLLITSYDISIQIERTRCVKKGNQVKGNAQSFCGLKLK
jgi:hypothetical protein